MPTATYTVKVKIGQNLMERINKVSEFLDVNPANFVEYAIDKELQQQEQHRLREDITLEEIRKNILAVGQELSPDFHESHGEDTVPGACQLCLKPISQPEKVDGPLLCDACLSLAKGGDLKKLEAQE